MHLFSTGPTSAILVTEDNITAEMGLRYDEAGRLVELQEDSPSGEGLFRLARFAWSGEEGASLPYAIEVQYLLDRDVEQYYYLYDAEGRLRGLDGVSFLETEPFNTKQVSVRYFYQSRTYDDIFEPIE